MRAVLFLALISVSLAFGTPKSAHASFLGWLGIREAGADSAEEVARAIDRAMRSLFFLQDEFDADITRYIEQIDRISEERLGEFFTAVDAQTDKLSNIAQQTIRDISDIQRQAFYDARDLIREVECLSPVYSQQIKETLGDILVMLSETNAELRIPIIGKTGEVQIIASEVEVQSPDIAYEDIKSGYLKAIEEMGEQASVLSIMASYGNISRVARITSCHYRGLSFSKYYFAEVAYYEGLSGPWTFVTGLDQF